MSKWFVTQLQLAVGKCPLSLQLYIERALPRRWHALTGKTGAAGVLLPTHYLTETGTERVCRHVEAVCGAMSLGVIVYNRNAWLNAGALECLVENALLGFKDGLAKLGV